MSTRHISMYIIKDRVFRRLKFKENPDVVFVEGEGVYVSYANGKAEISSGEKSCCARGLALLIKGIREGKTTFEIKEEPNFETRGIQLDLSRNAVMNVSALKKYIDYSAIMGLNSLIMYMEDVYELEGYPYFGYMRGAYSHDELKEIDDYAYEMGVEIIPHIQVLGHMTQYFKWKASAPVRNNPNEFLCDEDETYKMIEEMIKTMRKCFRTSRIHIGCDEAPNINQGVYLKKHGYESHIDIMNRHVGKVSEMCVRYGFKPMMYSDLYFTQLPGCNAHYDCNAVFDKRFSENIPDVLLVYWDYGRDMQWYEKVIDIHRDFGKEVVYAGGFWGWSDILPRYQYTEKYFIPGLKACINKKVSSVFATTWGDDGCECNKFYELFFAATLSEFCFKGADCTLDEIYEMSKFVFGIEKRFFEYVGELANPDVYNPSYGCSDTFYGKSLFYTDIFYNLTQEIDFYVDAKEKYRKCIKEIDGTISDSEWKNYELFAVKLYEILAEKAEIIISIRDEYENNNREYFSLLINETLPELKKKYEEIFVLWRTMWLDTNKCFGWEVINGRIGFMTSRIDYTIWRINEYLEGKIESIEELDSRFIPANEIIPPRKFRNLVTASVEL